MQRVVVYLHYKHGEYSPDNKKTVEMRNLVVKSETTIESLTNQIAELKAGRTLKVLKSEDKKAYYKVQSLSSKLSALKAADKGQYLTKAHLVEYKGLIIWLMKNKTNFKGHLNLADAMTILLEKVEGEKITFKTEKSIKGIVSELAIHAGLENVESNIRKAHGLEYGVDNSLNNAILDEFASFKINSLI